MIEFRYVIRKNRPPTAEKVRAYATEHGLPLNVAKMALEDKANPILQYRELPLPAIWKDVETIVEYRE
jgi:hypothetical protein